MRTEGSIESHRIYGFDNTRMCEWMSVCVFAYNVVPVLFRVVVVGIEFDAEGEDDTHDDAHQQQRVCAMCAVFL